MAVSPGRLHCAFHRMPPSPSTRSAPHCKFLHLPRLYAPRGKAWPPPSVPSILLLSEMALRALPSSSHHPIPPLGRRGHRAAGRCTLLAPTLCRARTRPPWREGLAPREVGDAARFLSLGSLTDGRLSVQVCPGPVDLPWPLGSLGTSPSDRVSSNMSRPHVSLQPICHVTAS